MKIKKKKIEKEYLVSVYTISSVLDYTNIIIILTTLQLCVIKFSDNGNHYKK